MARHQTSVSHPRRLRVWVLLCALPACTSAAPASDGGGDVTSDATASDAAGGDATGSDVVVRDAAGDVPADVSVDAGSSSVIETSATCAPGALPGGGCRTLSVLCNDLPAMEVQLRDYPAATGVTPRGAVVLASGGAGTDFYATSSTELDLVRRLQAAGYTVLDRAWQSSSGWFTGTGGLANVACRFTALLRYVRQRWPGGALCATGNSGGSVEVAYALTRAGAQSLLDLAVPSSGPFHSLALACGASDPTWASTCAALLAAQCPTCDASRCGNGAPPEIRSLINQAYGGMNVCTGDPATVDATRLAADSVLGPMADNRLANTSVHVVVGSRDPSGLPAFALATQAGLRDAGANATAHVATGAGHTVAGSDAGVTVLADLLTTDCIPRH